MVQGTGRCCIALLPAVVAILAIGSSLLSTVWCETIQFTPDVSDTSTVLNNFSGEGLSSNNHDGFATFRFGLFYYSEIQDVEVENESNNVQDTFVRVTDSCVAYDDNVDLDAAWKTARAFALIAPILGAFAALALFIAPCCIFFNPATWRSMAVVFLLVLPGLQSLTLLLLTSDACKDNPVINSRLDQALQTFGLEDTTATTTTIASNVTMGGNMTEAPTAATNTTTNGVIGSDEEDALRSIYQSDCEWDWGMYANLLSMILFFVTGVLMLIMGAPTRPPPKEPEIQTVTYEQKVDETGQVQVEEVNVTTETYKPNGQPMWADPIHPSSVPGGSGAMELEAAKPY